MTDQVLITETHHLRIQPAPTGVRFIAMHHDEVGLEAERDFPDLAAATAHAQAAYGVAPADWRPSPFEIYALVRILDTDPEAEIRGLTGHIVGLSTPDEVGVFIDALQEVWCVHPDHVVAAGGFLPETERPDPNRRIRISAKGDIL